MVLERDLLPSSFDLLINKINVVSKFVVDFLVNDIVGSVKGVATPVGELLPILVTLTQEFDHFLN